MAQKRMFDKDVIEQDDFLDLSLEAKAMYFLLGMEADDEGFVNPKKVIKLFDGKKENIDELVKYGLLLRFESGLVLITDWQRNNYLDKKRVKETIYKEEKEKIYFNKDKGRYVFKECLTDVPQMFNRCSKNVPQMFQENRIEENSIEYIKEEYKEEKKSKIKLQKHKYGKFNRILLTDKEYEKLVNDYTKKFIDNQIELLDEYVESNNNKNKYTNFNLVLRKSIRENWFKNNSNDIKEPEWFNKNNKKVESSKEEEKEMEDILDNIIFQ